MFLFVIAIIVALVGVVVGIIMICDQEQGYGFTAIITSIVVAAVLVFISASASVPTGHTGVLTTFGRVEDYTLDSGFHMKAPWQQVVKMDNRVQKSTEQLSCFSSDIQEVQIAYALNYQISKTNAQEIYRSIGPDYFDVVIAPNILEVVKVVTARYTAEQLVAARDELAAQIEVLLRDQLSGYNIEVVSTAIEDMDFTDAFTNAVEAKQVAVQNKLKAQTEQEQATMEQEQAAKRSVIDANAASEVAKIQAQADLEVTKIQADAAEYAGQKEAAKNKAISEFLTPELIEYYYILQWNGILPESYVGSDNVSSIVGMK